MDKYKIYPKVKEIEYFDGQFNLLDLDSSLEKSIDGSLHDEGYKIKIASNGIKISAKNDLALHYAMLTLRQILDQVDDHVSYLEIYDYPSFSYRGVIEGYYGIPWTFEEKKDLMKFAATYKANVFIYAPKDDPYHREKWYELYPQDRLEKLKDLAQTGIENSINFVWTIGPFFKHMINHDNISSSIDKIIAKFEQLYAIGVRQFGVLGDDVGSLDTDLPIEIMKALSKWRLEKKDVKDFLYCPANYTLEHEDRQTELNAYEKGFPDDVFLFHTGRRVCGPVKKEDLIEYKKIRSDSEDLKGKSRKNPIFWLNWPVNDIDPELRKIHMGPATMLDQTVEELKGIVTNPMQEAYASLMAIFAVSNYAWNSKDFDPMSLWYKSIELIDRDNFDDLVIILQNLSNQDDRGIKDLEESWDIKGLIISNIEDNFSNHSSLEELDLEFKKIDKAINNYMANAKNKLFLQDIKVYIYNLMYKIKAGSKFIQAKLSQLNDEEILSEALYEEGLDLYSKSKSYSVYVNPDKSKSLVVEGSGKYINPFIEKIKDNFKR
ncbi:MAG: beta-N-acetylglucosaminidase domain-containing protein [Tissierellia bacterium]|nr:beta-N-acetylglucosaminidase domain-containing protein [Tissierellia bacterium]